MCDFADWVMKVIEVFCSNTLIGIRKRKDWTRRQTTKYKLRLYFRISRGALLCNARINACSAQCLNSMHSFSAVLRGTLSLPLITPRYITRQKTPRKYRRFASASVGKHMKSVAWYEFCERARKSKIRATKHLAPPKSVTLQGVSRISFSDAFT